MTHKVLIVDDEGAIRESLAGILEDEGYQTFTAENGQQGLDIASAEKPDIVLLDIWMEGMDGLDVLSRLKRRTPELPVVMISGHGTIETAVQATQKGAYDFIEKPPQVERLLLTISRAIREYELRRENFKLRARTGGNQDLLGSSSEIANVRHLVKQVASSESRVLLTGENGTGKEVVARLIHQSSSRADKPFVVLSPGAVSENTMQTALLSVLEQANGGTLFLDEVADLTQGMQAQLLRFLHDGMIEDPASGLPRSANVRVVSATSTSLNRLVEEGRFRAELFYRLNVVPIHVPALRDRSQDVPTLVNYFTKVLSPDEVNMPKISPAAMAILTSYKWPGNVRQLHNMIEWLIIMYPGKAVSPEMLPGEIRQSEPEKVTLMEEAVTLPLRDAREMFERNYLFNQLSRFSGNISRTADFVGMERSALHRKLKSLGVEGRS